MVVTDVPEGHLGRNMPTVMELKTWLDDQGLTVQELAQELDVPLKAAQDWVFRGKVPAEGNQDRLMEYVLAACTHRWVIEISNGPLSAGVCRRCGQNREFQNSFDTPGWQISQWRKAE